MAVNFEPTKIGNDWYYKIGQVAQMVDRSVLTLRWWGQWSEEQVKAGKEPLIPPPIRVGAKGIRYYKVSDIPKIQKFAESIEYGQLAEFSRKKWGVRGKK